MKFITFDNVAIIGTGVMGKALGLAIKKNGLTKTITGMDIFQENLVKASNVGAIDDFTQNLETACKNKDFIIIATPIQKIIELMPRIAEYADPDAIVMDVGMTKTDIVLAARRSFPSNKYFIGCNPVVPFNLTEENMPDNPFSQRCCYVTVGTKSSHKAASDVVLFWKSLDAIPVIIRPERHDYLTGIISQLPYLASASLTRIADAFLAEDVNFLNKIVDDNFRFATKSSTISPDLFLGAAKTNQVNLVKLLSELKIEIEEMIKDIQAGNIEALRKKMMEARAFRIEITDNFEHQSTDEIIKE